MKNTKKILLIIFASILFFISFLNQYTNTNYNVITRNITLLEENIDYQTFFNKLEKQKLIYDKNSENVKFMESNFFHLHYLKQ